MGFSVVEKDRGVKFCVRVGLLSRQVFSHFGELWLVGSHGGGITFMMSEPSGTHPELAPEMTSAGSSKQQHSRWALAHILVVYDILLCRHEIAVACSTLL